MSRRTLIAATILLAMLAFASTAVAASPTVSLHIGDSNVHGPQPLGPNGTAVLTPGYPGYITTALRLRWPSHIGVNYGCSGATTVRFIRGGHCSIKPPPYGRGSMLVAAEKFLKRHRGRVKLVSISMGINDLYRCAANPAAVVSGCLQRSLVRMQLNLDFIASRLAAAAGPGVPLVGLTYFDPMLAFWLKGEAGQRMAGASVGATGLLNGLLKRVYRRNGFVIADVATAFGTYRPFTEMVSSPHGQVPVAVANICSLTWICSTPLDIHANDRGYALMGHTVLAAARGAT